MNAQMNLQMPKAAPKGNPLMQKPFSARAPPSKSPLAGPAGLPLSSRPSKVPPLPLNVHQNNTNSQGYSTQGYATQGMAQSAMHLPSSRQPAPSPQIVIRTINPLHPNVQVFTSSSSQQPTPRSSNVQQFLTPYNNTNNISVANSNNNNNNYLNPSQLFAPRENSFMSGNRSQMLTNRSRSSNAAPGFLRAASPPITLTDNVFENYKLITGELKRKEARLAELSNAMSKVRMSQGPDEVRALAAHCERSRQDLEQAGRLNLQEEAQRQELIRRLAELDQVRAGKLEAQARHKKLGQTVGSLNAELAATRQQFEALRAQHAKKDIDAKMEFEGKYRAQMEDRLLENVLEAASKSQSYDVQQLYAKLLAAKTKKDAAKK